MSQAPRSRPVPVALLVPSRQWSGPPARARGTVPPSNRPAGAREPGRASGAWPLLGFAALYLLFLASAALIALGLRPVPQTITESAYSPPPAAVDFDDLAPIPSDEAGPALPVDPGEARPRGKDTPAVAPDDAGPVVTELALADPARSARCDRCGTAIDFVRSPSVACRQAAREQKLVMILHLAGNFDDPGFT